MSTVLNGKNFRSAVASPVKPKNTVIKTKPAASLGAHDKPSYLKKEYVSAEVQQRLPKIKRNLAERTFVDFLLRRK